MEKTTLPGLRVAVSDVSITSYLDWVDKQICEKGTGLVLGQNLHSVYLSLTDEVFRNVYDDASLIFSDGFPIAFFASRAFKSKLRYTRIGSTDWIPLMGSIKSLQRIAVVGGHSEANKIFCVYLESILGSEIEVLGLEGSAWNEVKEKLVVERLTEFKPQVTLVGLGMPIQEHFIGRNLYKFSGIKCLVGGAIDQLSGFQKLAPRWLGALGLEWAWRLASEPKRLSKRYLIEPWILALLLLRQAIRR